MITEDVTAAEVLDHPKPHKGNLDLLHDPRNLQSLRKHHHENAKQMMERGKKVAIIGVDGQPRRTTRSTKRSNDGQQVVICYTPDVALIPLLPAALTGTAGLFCF